MFKLSSLESYVSKVLLVLLFLTGATSYAQDSETTLKEQADKLFTSEQFVEATPLFLRLIALDPRSSEYNFKYGSCLLFNSYRKQEALKYLKFSVMDSLVNPEAYYYLGKAYHLIFQFDDAINNYNIYLQKAGSKPKASFETQRQIEMCNNGKALLKNLLDLVVYEKKEVESPSFFRLYNLSNIGGVILVTADFQSKIDKKRNHIPLIHFPDNAKIVFYASYGEKDNGHKDIYYRQRMVDGSWGIPKPIQGSVNTNSDEDFPYLDPNGNYLYFSSKGHNSMGGYDVFRAKYNKDSETFSEVENMDFAVSSPSDDLFYIADSLGENAYFASSRQSANGKIHVYKVRVERVPTKIDQNLQGDALAFELQKKSELDVNASTFNLNDLNASKDRNKVLAEIGFDGATNQQINAKLEQIEQKQSIKVDGIQRIVEGANTSSFENAVQIEQLQNEIKKIIAESNKTDSQIRKNELLLEANEKVNQIQSLKTQIQESLTYADSVGEELPVEANKLKSFSRFKDSVQSNLIAENYTGLQEQFASNAILLKSIESDKKSDPIESLTNDNSELAKDVENLLKTKTTYQANQKQLIAEMNQLKIEKENAKAKIQPDIQLKIDNKQAELTLVEDEMKRIDGKISSLNKQHDANNEQIAFVTSIKQPSGKAVKSREEVVAKMESVNTVNIRTLEAFVKQQADKIENESVASTNHTELVSAEQFETSYLALENDFNTAQTSLENQSNLTPEEKQEIQLKNLDQYNNKLTNEKTKLDQAITQNPGNEDLQKQREKVEQKQRELTIEKDKIKSSVQTNTQTEVKSISASELLTELSPDLSKKEAKINEIKDEEKRLVAQVELKTKLLDQIDQALETTFDSIALQPLNNQLQSKKEALLQLKTQQDEALDALQEQLNQLQNKQQDQLSSVNIESEMKTTLPSYNEEKIRLGALPVPQNLTALNSLDSVSILTLNQQLESLNTSTDAVSEKRKVVIQEIKNQLEENILVRKQELTKLNQPDVITDSKPLEQLEADFQTKISEIEKSNVSNDEKQNLNIQAKSDLIVSLKNRKTELENQLETNPENQTLHNELTAVETSISTHEELLAESKQVAIAHEVGKQSETQVLSKYAPNFQPSKVDASHTLSSAQINQSISEENQLQDQLDQAKNMNNKQLEVKFDSELAAENKIIDRLIEQSNLREVKMQKLVDQAAEIIKQTEPQSIEKTLGEDYEFTMNHKPASSIEAKKQLSTLNELEGNINQYLEEERQHTLPDNHKINTLEQQLSAIKTRKDSISSSLSQLERIENQTLASNPSNVEKDLKQEEKALLDSLQQAKTEKEKQSIQELLTQNSEAQAKNEKIKSEIRNEELRLHTQELKAELEANNSVNPLKNQVIQQVNNRNSQSLTDRTADLTLLDATLSTLEAEDYFANNNQVLLSETTLNSNKRRFEIEVGELEQEMRLTTTVAERKSEIQSEIQVYQKTIQNINEQLNALRNEFKYDVSKDPALITAITPAEELQITTNPNYPELRTKQQQINREKWENNRLKMQLDTLRMEYNLVSRKSLKDTILQEMKALQNQITASANSIQKLEREIENSLTEKGLATQQWKNVLVRELPVAKAQTNLAEIVAPQIGEGFEIKKVNNEIQPNTPVKVIPIGVKAPSGLVYRVQVGAFAKPIPEDLFKEFTPVTGEKLDNGITRYLAGYFGDRQKVLQAQKDIRALGYTDAFVVAYCDGKRITLAEARNLEDQGLCKPMPQNQMVMELIENTIEQLPEAVKAEHKTEPKASDYNKAEGAAMAIATEEIKGLYYTVQIGVYNRPASKEQLHFIEPLVTKRLDNGQIRYSTGTFLSVDEARPKKAEAIQAGVLDAFITAYYNGERISLQEAKALFDKWGDTILIKPSELPSIEQQNVSVQTVEDYQKDNPIRELPSKHTVQFVSKQVFESFPANELNQLRLQGVFYYDGKAKRIKSMDYKEPLKLINSPVEFDTLSFVEPSNFENTENDTTRIVASWNISSLSGAWANWNIHLTIPYSMKIENEKLVLELKPISQEQFILMRNEVERFGGTLVK